MAGFCTKCGRPLPENGICPCTQQAQVPPQAQPVPQYQPQQPQYQPKQPQYQPQQQQYQPQYQQAPVQTPPKAEPQPPKEPSAFGLAIADLPKKFIRFVKDPVAETLVSASTLRSRVSTPTN